jgi:peptidoglycan/LPS O-acetylase OafA/YrhL
LHLVGVLARILKHTGPHPVTYSISPSTFLGNLFFLQTVASPVFGSNAPLWSLANEFWYYVLFPLLFCSLKRQWSFKSAFTIAFALLIIFALPLDLVAYGLIWSFGAITFKVSQRFAVKNFKKLLGLATSVLFVASLLATKSASTKGLSPFVVDFSTGLSFSILIWTIAQNELRVMPPIRYLITCLSDISYSLYLFHYPIVVAFGVLFIGREQRQPSFTSLLLFCFAFVAIVAFSWGAWYLFERNTNLIRRNLTSFLVRTKK